MERRRPRALVVEDQADARALVTEVLEAEGFAVDSAASLAAARQALERRRPDLVVLDRVLPDGEGLDLCRLLRSRERTRGVPILVLSARARPEERVLGLRDGADDYLAKPFHAAELAARAAVLAGRRAMRLPLECGGILLDPERHECRVHGRPVALWPREFELLRIFLERPGRLLTRDFLAHSLWDEPRAPSSRAVETAVQRLRRRLGPPGRRIETVRGYGFRLRDEHQL